MLTSCGELRLSVPGMDASRVRIGSSSKRGRSGARRFHSLAGTFNVFAFSWRLWPTTASVTHRSRSAKLRRAGRSCGYPSRSATDRPVDPGCVASTALSSPGSLPTAPALVDAAAVPVADTNAIVLGSTLEGLPFELLGGIGDGRPRSAEHRPAVRRPTVERTAR